MAKSKDRDREKKSSKKRRRDVDERSPSKERKSSSSRRKSSNGTSSSSSSRKHVDKRRRSSKSASRDSDDTKKKKQKEEKSPRSHGSGKKKSEKRREAKDEGNKNDAGKHDSSVQAEIQISDKDYFTRAMEFKVWLFHKKKKYFEDLTSTESHDLFDKFVKDWNRGKLDPHFYEGRLPEDLVARTKKTQHKWGFLKKLSDRDQMQLELANDSVHSSTEKVKGVASNVPVLPAGSAPPRGEKRGTERGGKEGDDDGERKGGGRRTEVKRQRRQEREKHAVVLDEIAPKETGRQATMDKRREVGARTHAAARAREDAADGLDMKEADTMGGGDSFHETLARAKHGKQRRQTAKTEHLQGLAAKEEEKRAVFLAQMGLKAGQKITIQPRRDT